MRINDNIIRGSKLITLSHDEIDCLAHGYDVRTDNIHITTEDGLKPVTVTGGSAIKTRVTLGSLGQGMTPNDLEILIHYYVSPSEHPRAGAPAVDESCTRMV